MFDTRKSFELSILVAGKPIPEFEHEGNIFIEGRKGSEFELQFKNNTSKQVLVVPSVDGKSVFTGKPATADSTGYIVRAYGQIRIPGWTLDQSAVAKFFFEDKDKSYSAAVTPEGDPVVTGVIGVLVYSEKARNPILHIDHTQCRPKGPAFPQNPWPYNNPTYTVGGTAGSEPDVTKSVLRSRSATAMNATLSASSNVDTSIQASSVNADATPFEMGAGFGQKSDFKTTTTAFERDSIVATMQLYYDSRRNLEKRGIVVVKKVVPGLPQAFTGLGCTPPEGWQG